MYTFEARNTEELIPIAERFLQLTSSKGVYFIRGEMGAGKTTFMATVCKALGLEFQGSPTFSLVNEYHLPNGNRLYHFDLYRIKNTAELIDIGLEDYLNPENLVLIEWPDLAQPIIPQPDGQVEITDTQGVREILIRMF